MHGLDFISDSPRTYIFQKGSNKTNLGGVLALIYLIILIFIAVAYILEYSLNEKFEFSYFHRQISNKQERQDYLKDKNINPNISFYFDVLDKDGNPLDDTFEVREFNNFSHIIGRNVPYNRRVDDLGIVIAKKCEYEGCRFNESDIRPYLYIYYNHYSIDHYNEGEPVTYKKIEHYFRGDYINNSTMLYEGFWGVYIYAEKKGLGKVFDYIIDKTNNYTIGTIDDYYSSNVGNFRAGYNESTYKCLLFFGLYNDLEGIKMYSRKKKSIFDCFANIAALSTTVFSFMVKAFAIVYSRNFDNYKIMEKILSKGIKPKKEEEIELSNNVKSNNNNDDDLNKLNLENNLIDKENKENISDEKNLVTNDEMNIMEENTDEPINLPKLRFFDFFFNNVYNSKLCVSLKKQKLISSCDNVLYKYYSIENILMNQILFENLMKDYKWNNPKLKSIRRNEMIVDLKKYL